MSKQKNIVSGIYEKVLPPKEIVHSDTKPERTETRLERQYFPSVAQRVAKSPIHMGNWPWQGAREAFPNDPLLRTVDKFFPYAEGGPLLVDEPLTKDEVKMCERKAPFLRAKGYRYLILKEDMDEMDALVQLSVLTYPDPGTPAA